MGEENKEKIEEEKERDRINIGPLLREALNIHKERIRDATHNCVEATDKEAGEIIAKKIMGDA